MMLQAKHSFDDQHPVKGSEIFVGGLPRTVTESRIHEVFATCGEIAEIRLMKDQSGIPKGFCFIRFATKEAASRAVKEKSGLMLEGKKIGVSPSADQCSLFLGNLHKDWSADEFDKLVRQAFQDVVSVDLAMPPSSGDIPLGQKQQNRGFGFVQFSSHAAAARAHRMGSKPDFLLGGKCHPVVDWAEMEPEIDPEELAKIKVAYVGNLPANVSENYLKKLFEPLGKVERVALSRKGRFPVGFIHFANRLDLDNAIKEMDGKMVQGPDKGPSFKIQVAVAKPVDKDRKRARDESQSKIASKSTSLAKFSREDQANDSSGGHKLKAPRIKNSIEAPDVTDPYEAAVVSLPAAVAECLLRILRLGIATRFDIDIQCITSLKELPQSAAITVLNQFMLSGTEKHNKGAYLAGLIAEHHVDKLGLKQNPLHLSRIGNFAPRESLLPSLSVQAHLPTFNSLDSFATRYDSYMASPGLPRYSSTILDDPLTRQTRPGKLGEPSPISSYRKPVSSKDYGNIGSDAHLKPVSSKGYGNIASDSHITPVSSEGYGNIGSDSHYTAAGSHQPGRPQIRFDPFTGQPYKFDPFTGEPIQPQNAPRRSGSLYS